MSWLIGPLVAAAFLGLLTLTAILFALWDIRTELKIQSDFIRRLR